jgi:sigma-B regulation protein RsbU (phosphoserine phosphatase)
LLNPVGRFLGLLPNLIVEEDSLTFQTGDTLICYSDGVTDAVRRGDGELYGLERLKEIVSREGHRSANDLLKIIVSDVDNFRNGEEQPDDLTLLVTKAV